MNSVIECDEANPVSRLLQRIATPIPLAPWAES
jgi:hypothetical protein